MAYGIRVAFDAVREISFGSIGASYTGIGSALTDHARLIALTSTLDTEVYVSLDGSTDHLRLAVTSFKLLDLSTNRESASSLFLPKGTVFYVKRVSGAPTTGAFWIEVMYAAGGK